MLRYKVTNYEFKELLTDYLTDISAIQKIQSDMGGISPYALEMARVEKHKQIEEFLGIETPLEKEKLKEWFSKLDVLCSIYSQCDDWKLETDRDIKDMTKYIIRYLSCAEGEGFIEGKLVLKGWKDRH